MSIFELVIIATVAAFFALNIIYFLREIWSWTDVFKKEDTMVLGPSSVPDDVLDRHAELMERKRLSRQFEIDDMNEQD